jgi:hypothetical protein
MTPWWWTLRGPKHVGVYFRVLNIHVFYVVVGFIGLCLILSALVGLCDDYLKVLLEI